MNTYKTKHTGQCPNNGDADYYDITIKSEETIMVEDINKALGSAPKEIYQEGLVHFLRKTLPMAKSIKVVGDHQGVKVTSELTQ